MLGWGFLLSVGKGSSAAAAAVKLRLAVERVIEDEVATVRNSAPRTLVLVTDICWTSTQADLVVAVGTTPGSTADAIGKKGRLKIGLLSCRAWIYERRNTRCFRCHDYGHMRRECKGPDRSSLCMTCDGQSHQARDCKAQPNCVLCKDKGRSAWHYPGSGQCSK